MALAITDDHAAQEAAFYDAPTWQRHLSYLRERLTERETDAHRHSLVRFVGLDADDEHKADALQEEGERLCEPLQALEDGLQDYNLNVKAAAGAIVTIDRSGVAVVHRGLMREAEAKALRTLERLRQGFNDEDAANEDEGEDDAQPKAAAMSDRLAQRLSAHRTAALQIEVARHPQAALAAVVHGMVQTVLQESHYGLNRDGLSLGVRVTVQDRLESLAPGLAGIARRRGAARTATGGRRRLAAGQC